MSYILIEVIEHVAYMQVMDKQLIIEIEEQFEHLQLSHSIFENYSINSVKKNLILFFFFFLVVCFVV